MLPNSSHRMLHNSYGNPIGHYEIIRTDIEPSGGGSRTENKHHPAYQISHGSFDKTSKKRRLGDFLEQR